MKRMMIRLHKLRFKGFTLVELLLVMAIIGIISSISILSLLSFQRHQRLVSAVREVNSILSLAKSRAQSQVMPEYCATNKLQLTGYRVTLVPSDPGRCSTGICTILVPVCNGTDIDSLNTIKILPSGIDVNSDNGTFTFLFNVLSGTVTFLTVTPSVNLNFTYGTDAIRITIYSDGRVSLVE